MSISYPTSDDGVQWDMCHEPVRKPAEKWKEIVDLPALYMGRRTKLIPYMVFGRRVL